MIGELEVLAVPPVSAVPAARTTDLLYLLFREVFELEGRDAGQLQHFLAVFVEIEVAPVAPIPSVLTVRSARATEGLYLFFRKVSELDGELAREGAQLVLVLGETEVLSIAAVAPAGAAEGLYLVGCKVGELEGLIAREGAQLVLVLGETEVLS